MAGAFRQPDVPIVLEYTEIVAYIDEVRRHASTYKCAHPNTALRPSIAMQCCVQHVHATHAGL
jgi:hypothetical protein